MKKYEKIKKKMLGLGLVKGQLNKRDIIWKTEGG